MNDRDVKDVNFTMLPMHEQMMEFMINAGISMGLATFKMQQAAHLEKKKEIKLQQYPPQQFRIKYANLYDKMLNRIQIRCKVINQQDWQRQKGGSPNGSPNSRPNNSPNSRPTSYTANTYSQMITTLNKLRLTWEECDIAMFHRVVFLQRMLIAPIAYLLTLMQSQCTLVRKQQHILYSISRGIKARQACRLQLQNISSHLSPQLIQQHLFTIAQRQHKINRKQYREEYNIRGYKAQLNADKHQYRAIQDQTEMELFSRVWLNLSKLTRYVLDMICTWREYIGSLAVGTNPTSPPPPYIYRNCNYILTMLNDNAFLYHSALSQVYAFARRNDPFLFYPVFNTGRQTVQKEELVRLICGSAHDRQLMLNALPIFYQEYRRFLTHKHIYDINPMRKGILSKEMQNGIQKGIQKGMQKGMQKEMSNKKQKQKQKEKQNQNQKTTTSISLLKISKVNHGANSLKTFRIKDIPISKSQVKLNSKLQPQQDNPDSTLAKSAVNPMADSVTLHKVKEEVMRQLIDDIYIEKRNTLLSNVQIHEYIDDHIRSKLKQAMQQREQDVGRQITITTVGIPSSRFPSFLSSVYRRIPSYLLALFPTQQDMLTSLLSAQHSYVIKCIQSIQGVGRSKQNQQQKFMLAISTPVSIQIVFIQIAGDEQPISIERRVLKVVQWVRKYQNANLITLKFRKADNIQTSRTSTLLNELRTNLSLNSNVISSPTTLAFQFKHPSYIQSDPHRSKLYIHQTALLSQNQIDLTANEQDQHSIDYQYLLMRILQNHISGEEFQEWRRCNNSRGKDRFRGLLEMLMDMGQQHKSSTVHTIYQGENTMGLYRVYPSLMRLPIVPVSATCAVTLLQMSMTLTIALDTRVAVHSNNRYLRYKLGSRSSGGCNTMILPIRERKDVSVFVFSGSPQGQSLHQYIQMQLKKSQGQVEQHKHDEQYLFVEMHSDKDKDKPKSNPLSTCRCTYFPIKPLYISWQSEWNHDIPLQLGIHYQIGKGDIVINKPYGIALLMNTGNKLNVIWARLIK